ncbi:ABC transporter FUM19 [Metarhizium brunneum]|uniref:ABC transporter FUM19 n=1 Tax=Metarhizium brunneum TaxID=500148 RepID=A0A7D5Z422_9HYPO
MSTCLGDNSIGPAVVGCRGDFDFTITFEETILSILPSACFIFLATPRLWVLSKRQNTKVKRHATQWLKSAFLVALVALNLGMLALAATWRPRNPVNNKIVAAGAMSSVAALLLLLLSNIEHMKSQRPSILISLYLSPTTLFDVARTRTWRLESGGRSYTAILTAKTVLQFTVILLEAMPKFHLLRGHETHTDTSPEETSGIFSLAFFYWLNPLVYKGSKKILKSDDLYPLDKRLSVSNPLNGFNNLSGRSLKPDLSSVTLLFRLVQTVGPSLLKPVPARLLLIGFSFCQPFFIQRLTSFLQEDASSVGSIGVGLIGASILIYSGLALSTSMYWYCQYRVLTRFRATLGHIIYDKSLQLPTVDDGVLTVMSMDVNRVYGGLHNVHELWANTIEVALAAWLLQRQIGTASVTPIIIVGICVSLTVAVGKFAAKYQGDWSQKTQDRVKLTSSVIAQIKELELSGRSTQIAALMQRLREDELDAGAKFRLLGTVSTCVAFGPMLLAPVITFAFTSIGRGLDTSQVYASLSCLTLLSSPLSQLFQTVPSMLASTASFKRIYDFLSKPNRAEYRSTLRSAGEKGQEQVISLRDVSFGWQEDKWSLVNLNIAFSDSQLSIVTGPVASGKSTLCMGILGEVPFVQGTVSVRPTCFGQIGFCGQTPFLTNDSIRANIVGPDQKFHEQRYKSVLQATLLDVDIRNMLQHDETLVGSNGMNLSGGQKQRVALARALYLDATLYVLDDTLSGLDTQTSNEVTRRLFGADGILRTKTVIWCTHSTEYLSLAQQVIVLGKDGKVQSCGPSNAEATSLVEESILDTTEKHGISSSSSSNGERPVVKSTVEGDNGKRLLRSRHDGKVYTQYIKALRPRILVLALVTGTLFSFGYNFGTVWVGFWAKNSFHWPDDQSQAFYLGLLALFEVFGLVSLAGFLGSTQMQMPRQAGSELHLRALKCLFSLPLTYFSSVDKGTTTNLFSQDMGMLDNQLVFAISNTLLSGFTVIGQLVVVAVATPYIAIGYPFFFGVLYLLQNYYLKTSRQLRLLDLEARSPLYSRFQDVVAGLISIRAFQWMNQYQKAFDLFLNQSLQPDYLLDLAQQWLTLNLNLIVGIIAVVVTCFATQIVASSHAGLVGASLVSLMTLSELACATVRSWVQLETSLGAVKRLQDFDDNPTREADQGRDPPVDWPTSGQITIDGVSAAYGSKTSENALVLRDIHLSVSGGEKVAIIGRTGSGKSSLLLLLMRLLHTTPDTSDKMTVDGIQLQHLSPQALRQRIIAVPQELMFLPGTETFRQLLDPDGNLSDEQCRTAIVEVGLNDLVEDLGGLDALMSEDKLSHGQKQLLSLAVAVARKLRRDQADMSRDTDTEKGSSRGILLLDEVTANVNFETEDKMLEVIFRVFGDYTVLNITHRLRSLHQFDAVYSMSGGKINAIKDAERPFMYT